MGHGLRVDRAFYLRADRQRLDHLAGRADQAGYRRDRHADGLLPGLSFAAPFAILGVLAGYLVDRMSRRRIIGIGVVLWSLMTFSCGLAQNYWQFFFTRLGAAAPRPPRRAGAGGGSRLSGHAAAFEIGRADVFVCE